jgi:hypothetical protein
VKNEAYKSMIQRSSTRSSLEEYKNARRNEENVLCSKKKDNMRMRKFRKFKN